MTTETGWSGAPPVPRLADAGQLLQVYGMAGPHETDAFLRSVREANQRGRGFGRVRIDHLVEALLGAVHPDKSEHVEPYREALDRLAARAAPAARTETLRGAIRKEL